MAWIAPRTWVTGEIATASFLNVNIRDNLNQTGPAIVTTDGDIIAATGANVLKRLAAMSGDVFKHELGGVEADISAITTGGSIVGQSSGVAGVELIMTQAQAEAGNETQVRGVSALLVKQSIAALASASPSGMISYFANSCPTGWSEFTQARGRYVVGLPSGGTGTATVGTALSDEENRAVGQHKHIVAQQTGNNSMSHNTTSHVAAISSGGSTNNNNINVTGNVADTNAPYVQLICCEKD